MLDLVASQISMFASRFFCN